ncbi:PIN domain-containing protein [Lentzea tibetensis]|uniref:PIN domain-containing protein n=1 Tax=Lentzea tibetensis TaxID=2591470 RepID=A0A563EHX9_9PSEU|nr:PIN domain-containing protein [Lentzea tibetensis]TWP45214.1 PIN domain-containing protein [Lentzea tibetensis]
MGFPVFLDACVLVPIRLADLLLRLAEAETYRPLWSPQVLTEVGRNLPRLGVDPAKAQRRVQHMLDEFPDAMVTGYDDLVSAMTNDPKDRHVLAAAVHAKAAVIVTANLRDFPPDALSPYRIRALHPDDFLLDQLDLHLRQTLACVRDQIAAYRRPPLSVDGFLDGFAKCVPRFAETVRELLGA